MKQALLPIVTLLLFMLACTFGKSTPPPTVPEPAPVSQTESQPVPLPPLSGDVVDPADLTRVAMGGIAPWEPQSYAALDFDDRMFFNPAGVELDLLGVGVQRRSRIGDVAYDRANGLLYVLELYADGAKPVVHVWRIR